jgi:hypothetical protein
MLDIQDTLPQVMNSIKAAIATTHAMRENNADSTGDGMIS